jgi:hypothetical protein
MKEPLQRINTKLEEAIYLDIALLVVDKPWTSFYLLEGSWLSYQLALPRLLSGGKIAYP